MEYRALLEGIGYTGTPPSGEATAVVQDSRKVVPGCVFVCIRGRGFDGHEFAALALKAGAGMVVSGRPLGLASEVTVADTRRAYALISQNYFGNPAQKLVVVGVTGTNGKTTVASVLKQTLCAMDVKCGLIGTIQSEIGDAVVPAKFTTPEAWDIAALMARMVKAGCTHLVMEASSQALEQGRLYGIRFALGIFTNLTQDHLDYHGDMKAYYAAKRSLFEQCDAMLTNLDDAAGRRLLDEGAAPEKRSYSTEKNMADFSARDIGLSASGVKFAFLGSDFLRPVRFAIPGAYSVANALAAGSAAIMLGYPPDAVSAALSGVPGVRGRCEVIHNGDFTVITDFAHTADGVDKLLGSLKPFVTGRLMALFGNAGDRDAGKRLAMGEAAARHADVIYITADNPRTEDIMKTIEDSMEPIRASGKPFVVEPDREKAQRMALDSLKAGDMLVLCTKGHEDYQVMDGYTLLLDERMIFEDWMNESRVNG